MTIRSALLMAAALIALSLVVSYLDDTGRLGEEASQRTIQVAIGLLLVFVANRAPKTLEPLRDRCDPGAVQSLQRFSGWMLVVGGLGYAVVWLVAPIDHARISAIAILATCVLIVLARVVWTLASTRG